MRASNGGVLPPDLSGIVKAHRGAAVRVSDCDAVFRAFMRVRTSAAPKRTKVSFTHTEARQGEAQPLFSVRSSQLAQTRTECVHTGICTGAIVMRSQFI